MKILGISAFYHDSAVCYIDDTGVVACLQEERFSRRKHDDAFPVNALNVLRERYGLIDENLDAVVFYDKPVLKFDRIIHNLIQIAPRGFRFAYDAMPLWISGKIFISDSIRKHIKGKYSIYYTPHHISHAASAYFASEYDKCAFIVNDGVGEWDTTSYGICSGNSIETKKSIHYPDSLGMFYSAFTYFCGFRVNSGEYKLMGLAPYGKPVYADIIREHLIDIREDGSYRLNLKYFDYQYGRRMCSRRMEDLLGVRIRNPEDPMTPEYADIAASVQEVLEDVLVKMAKHVRKETGMEKLLLAGGVSLNCVANSRIMKEAGFSEIFIQPASGDAGGALGAALYTAATVFSKNIENPQNYSYLGTEYSDDAIEAVLKEFNVKYSECTDPAAEGAKRISRQEVLGWFQGRMEFGPRALGARSILGDPRDPEMQKKMNLKIKYRESFRPFAPSVLEEMHEEYFEENFHTPYMLTVSTLKDKYRRKGRVYHDFGVLSSGISDVPAVTHADFTSRVQTVNSRQNPLYHNLIDEFRKLTGIGMVINTSFNVRGQPIVESPYDALATFFNTEMDSLIMGGFIVEKNGQDIDKEAFRIENIIPD